MQTIWFKRMVSVLLLSALALSVAGCQSRYTPRESSSAAPSAQTGTGGGGGHIGGGQNLAGLHIV